jgi:hypothetical protein
MNQIELIICFVGLFLATVLWIVAYVMDTISLVKWSEAARSQKAVKVVLTWQKCEKVYASDQKRNYTVCSGQVRYPNPQTGIIEYDSVHWSNQPDDKELQTFHDKFWGECFGFKGGMLPAADPSMVPYSQTYTLVPQLDKCRGPEYMLPVYMQVGAYVLCAYSLFVGFFAFWDVARSQYIY